MPLADRIGATMASLGALAAFVATWAALASVGGALGLLFGWAPAIVAASLAFEAVAALFIQITESIR